MSISAPQARKSAEPLEGKKIQAEAGNPDLMPGKRICAVRPVPSIGPKNFPWPREFVLMCEKRNSDVLQTSLFAVRMYEGEKT
jgi:hypothetical protein